MLAMACMHGHALCYLAIALAITIYAMPYLALYTMQATVVTYKAASYILQVAMYT